MSELLPLLHAIGQLGHLPTDAQRCFHGRGGAYPGCEAWTLDWYAPVWLLTCFAPVSDTTLAQAEAVHQALAARWSTLAPDQPLNLVLQHRDEVRADTRVLAGTVPEPHVVSEAGARYKVHLMRGYNHGLFLDMAEGRRWVREHVAEQVAQAVTLQPSERVKVLNLFAYTCAFSVAARQGGAAQVVNVDMAAGALGIGKANHQLNGLAAGASFLPHDIFSSWGKISRLGPYQLVIADPPSYQKGSFVAEKDYARLVRRLPGLLTPGGHALLCLNSPKHTPAFIQDVVAAEAPELQFVQRLPNPAGFPDAQPDRGLKVLLFRLDDHRAVMP